MPVTDPVGLTAVLLLLVVASEWLGSKKYFSYIGSSLLVIILGALLANTGIIPSSLGAPPLYDGIFTYIAPLSIFYLLLDVKLNSIKQAGLHMLILFAVGAAATVAGTLAGYFLLLRHSHSVPDAYAVAGMYTGTYIGGSANLNAVALQYGVYKNGTLFAAINAADNIITAVWMIATLGLPVMLRRLWPAGTRSSAYAGGTQPLQAAGFPSEQVTLPGLSLLLTLGFSSLYVSGLISTYLPQVPAILVLTTLALLLAQVKALHGIAGGKTLGFLFVLLFLAVVGAFCDIGALMQNKDMALLLLTWVFVIVMVHGIFIFGIGGLWRQDWYLVSIASNANIGGATSAAALATSLNRPDLRLPGILAGSLGNAIGTYIAFAVAEWLR